MRKLATTTLMLSLVCHNVGAHSYPDALQRYDTNELIVLRAHPAASKSTKGTVTILDPDKYAHIAMVGSRVGKKNGAIFLIRPRGICVYQMTEKEKPAEGLEIVFLPARGPELPKGVDVAKERVTCQKAHERDRGR